MQSVSRNSLFSAKSTDEALGKELLTMLGRSPNPATAFHLCVQLGLMNHHENLYLLEAGIDEV